MFINTADQPNPSIIHEEKAILDNQKQLNGFSYVLQEDQETANMAQKEYDATASVSYPYEDNDEDNDFTLYECAQDNIEKANLYEKQHNKKQANAYYLQAAQDLLNIEEDITFDHHLTAHQIAALCYLKTDHKDKLAIYQKIKESSLKPLQDAMEDLQQRLKTDLSEEELINVFFACIFLSPPVRGIKTLCLFADDYDAFMSISALEISLFQQLILKMRQISDEESEEGEILLYWYYALHQSLIITIKDISPIQAKKIEDNLSVFLNSFDEIEKTDMQWESKETFDALQEFNNHCKNKNLYKVIHAISNDSFLQP